jgi:hypothetical protein
MGIFGWSYPPGCNGTPFDEDHPCELCGKLEDDCICPECPKCGEVGRKDCYNLITGCGLLMTEEQVASLKAQQEAWQKQAQQEAQWAEEEIRERGKDHL